MNNTSQSRLNNRLQLLGSEEFGWVEGKGMHAMECTPANKKTRAQLKEWMEEEGMTVTTDQVGNVIGILMPEGCDSKTPPLIMGSHVDTVVGGGRLGGRYGVLAGLEAVHKLKEGNAKLTRPVIVAAWTNEESAIWQPGMPGSAATAHPEKTDEILDKCKNIAEGPDKGKTLRQALTEIGANGTARPGFFLEGINPADAIYLEAHIEQGPSLEREGKSIAVVSDIYGCSQSTITIKAKEGDASANVARAAVELTQRVNGRVAKDPIERGTVGKIDAVKTEKVDAPAVQIIFAGEGDHAGGRSMLTRHDAAYAASSVVEQMGSNIVIENLTIPNGFPNRVPSDAILTVRPPEGQDVASWKSALEETTKKLADERGVTFKIQDVSSYERMTEATVGTDKRHIKQEGVKASETALDAAIEHASQTYGVDIAQRQGTQVKPAHCDDGIVTILKDTAEENPVIREQSGGGEKGSVRIMQSGPFHDGIELTKTGMRLGMVFVPSVNGISHDKAEFTHPKDLDVGVDVLAAAARKLACEHAVEKGQEGKPWGERNQPAGLFPKTDPNVRRSLP